MQSVTEDAPPPPGPAEVDCDRAQPRLGIVRMPELPLVLDRPGEGLLDDVLGLAEVATHGVQLSDQAPVGRHVDLPDEVVVHAAPFRGLQLHDS
jgi:hypothetical protein